MHTDTRGVTLGELQTAYLSKQNKTRSQARFQEVSAALHVLVPVCVHAVVARAAGAPVCPSPTVARAAADPRLLLSHRERAAPPEAPGIEPTYANARETAAATAAELSRGTLCKAWREHAKERDQPPVPPQPHSCRDDFPELWASWLAERELQDALVSEGMQDGWAVYTLTRSPVVEPRQN